MATIPDLQQLLPTDRMGSGSLEAPIEAIPVPAAIIAGTGAFICVNSCWNEAYPSTQKGDHCVSWCDFVHRHAPTLRSELISGLDDVLSGARHGFAQTYPSDKGQSSVSISSCSHGVLIVAHRVPEEHEAASAARAMQSHKMETVGRLVGGVTHDFANLLTLIAGYSDVLLSRMADADPLRPELDEIRKAATRGARLTGQLLGYTRGQTFQPCIVDLNEMVADLQRMLRPLIGENIALETFLTATPGKVVADPGQMEQVIMNLLLNARDAMPQGGRIRIETSDVELDSVQALERGIKPGGCVLLTISDDGHGMGRETLERLFEPFFTTKEAGKGTGLGLSTVRDIVKQIGDITVESAPTAGARFTLWLPSATGVAENRAVAAQPLQPVSGHETLLLAEDEESVRRLLAYVLRRKGYEVLEACSGEEALQIFESRGNEINLVITDMVMPGLSGRELSERLWRARPEMPFVFMSGYTNDVLVRTGVLSAGMSFLQKPLRPETFVAKIREALDSTVQPPQAPGRP